jgi:predicted homoserine dehydrogenase-like protein
MGATWLTDDAEALIHADGLEVVVEATGAPDAGLRHALMAFEHGRHVVMVNVEADALVGPLLARRARAGSTSSARARARSTCPRTMRRRPIPSGITVTTSRAASQSTG